jgi:hypothetical protein
VRKRSKYRPKGVLLNPVGYVLESMSPLAKHNSYVLDLKIKNHEAMTALTKGVAKRNDIDMLITMGNVTEAMYRLGFGADYGDVVKTGLDSLRDVARRGAESHRFILRAAEMSALNALIELHDAQIDVATIRDMENALKLIDREYRSHKMVPIVEKRDEHTKSPAGAGQGV